MALSARQLTVARAGAWWSRAPASCDSTRCAPQEGDRPWEAVLAAFAQWLAGQGGRHPVLRIILSGRFVRWQMLPWRDDVVRPDEMSAYASLCFRETFGPVADRWQVLYSAEAPGRPVPACAVDQALLDALRDNCAQAGARLVSVTPYFSSACRHWHRVLDRRNAWFGVVESDSVTLGLRQGGQWTHLHSQQHEGDWVPVLPRMMAQTGVLAGVQEASVPIYLAGTAAPSRDGAGAASSWLQPRSAVAWPASRMALGL